MMAPGRVEAAIDWFDSDPDSTVPLRVLWGARENLEVGGMFSFNDASDVWGVNAKIGTRFLSGPSGGTALGFKFVDARDVDSDGWQVYGVHTRVLGNPWRTAQLRGSFGVSWTHVDYFTFNDDAFRIFGALDAVMDNGWIFGVEMQSGSSRVGDDGPLSSIYARYRVNDRVTLQAGFTNAALGGLASSGDHDIFLGASYAFGGGSGGENLELAPTY
jgi:hypothetical protein